MIQVIDRTNAERHAATLRSFAELRYGVFIRQLGWALPLSADGQERDQFDDADAVYLTISNAAGQVVAGARLLDTARHSLLADIFPHLVDGAAPSHPSVFEITRFVVDPRAERVAGCGDLSAELLWGLQEYAAHVGLRELVSVSYVALERLLRRGGYRIERLGAPCRIDGTLVAALRHEVSPDVRARTHARLEAVGLNDAALHAVQARLALPAAARS